MCVACEPDTGVLSKQGAGVNPNFATGKGDVGGFDSRGGRL